MKEKIFITGGNGGIGGGVCEVLKDNYEIISPNSKEFNLLGDINVQIKKYSNVEYVGFVHIAGINILKGYDEIESKDFNDTMKINTISFLEIIKNLKFKENANIISIGSIYSNFTKEKRLNYTASKHALLGITKTLALELAPKKILVNCISPGFYKTRLTIQNNTEERMKEIENKIPLKRMGKPDEIARLVEFFIKSNTYITGQNIFIDGGVSIQNI